MKYHLYSTSPLRYLLLLILCLAYSATTMAQSGRFDLRLRQQSSDCATRKVVFALEVRASDADHTFTLASSNLRFSYPTAVLNNPVLSSQVSYATGNYGAQTFVNQDGIVTININYQGGVHTDTINVNTTWRTVSQITFDIPQASTGCYSLNWNTTDFPSLEVYQLDGGPSNEVPATLGTASNATGCAFTVPTATLTGTQSVDKDEAAMLTIAYTGTAPWKVTLSNGNTYTSSNTMQMIEVYPTASTSYTITKVEDACSVGTSSGSAVVSIKDPGPTCRTLCAPISYRIIRN
ncbi:hypothetical protein [Telluribacter sp. SYSU D00476]|uniref:hypothetical protein n=1 Tax=Telluribacter sp. SYSU D00476 TaxID=2811430 RepID=UPI001FF62B2C|nr:hypothetical protein [Telluribacter sp. SYSU D00476]